MTKIFTQKQILELLTTRDFNELKTTENFALIGFTYKTNKKDRYWGEPFKAITIVLTHKRNVADIIASYVIYDMEKTKGLMLVNRYKQTEINKIAYSLKQGIKEQQELENFVVEYAENMERTKGE
jgi:hypothetical protein